jgi:hypothetical protein
MNSLKRLGLRGSTARVNLPGDKICPECGRAYRQPKLTKHCEKCERLLDEEKIGKGFCRKCMKIGITIVQVFSCPLCGKIIKKA